jgi:hypothetical protein
MELTAMRIVDKDSPPVAHCHKKEKQSPKTDEEVNDDHGEPEIEVVDKEDAIASEPNEDRNSDKVSRHHYQEYIQCSHW